MNSLPALGAMSLLIATSSVLAVVDEHRTIDGSFNNVSNPDWGSAGVTLLRLTTVGYGDGISSPGGIGMTGPRDVSNITCVQPGNLPNGAAASGYLWQWGQFVDHDMDLTPAADPAEAMDIPVPMGDPFFDPDETGTQVIFFDRSIWDLATGTGIDDPRQQLNQITAFIDASQVYGSDPVRAAALRTNDGTGRLASSGGDLLPFNTGGLPNAGGPGSDLFLAGDVRCNEQVALTSMHTLFVREHNRLAAQIAADSPGLPGNKIYERARKIVGAQMQVITFKEFLPVLVGPDAIEPYLHYYSSVDPGIANIFSTAAFRCGHSMLNESLMRIDANGLETAYGHLPLRDAFFAPFRITDEGGIDPVLRGLAAQPAQDIDTFVIDDIRNFLFGPPGSGGFDLASLNVQRGRDHGLPFYNQARQDYDLDPVADFAGVTSDPAIQAALAEAYTTVDEMDAWIGGLAEDHVEGAMLGELFRAVIVDQFTRLRDGDRFWYERTFRVDEVEALEATTLADIIRRNTDIGDEIPDDVFHFVAPCPGDVNGDGFVDVGDLVEVITDWGLTDSAADINGDGLVDVTDLVMVIQEWGKCG